MRVLSPGLCPGNDGLAARPVRVIIVKYLLPALSAGFLVMAVGYVGLRREDHSLLPPPNEPPRSPFGRSIAARGIVEPETETIDIASPVAGVVAEVFVRPGEQVQKGTPLFRLDSTHVLAELRVREAAMKVAKAELDCLARQPRPEELPIARARVRRAESQLTDCEDRARRLDASGRTSAPEQEIAAGRQAVRIAQAGLDQARAELDLLTSGAWPPRLAACSARVAQAEAAVQQTKMELTRLTICAPICGEVLRVRVHPGEFVTTPPDPLSMVLGNTRRLHIRVDIDEHEIPRFRPNSPARAMASGNPHRSYALEFVRVEPTVVPKAALGGSDYELVDTRVLQAVYRLEPSHDEMFFVGQQLEVYIEK